MKVLLLHRAESFSPNNVEKDALLLEAVGERLGKEGHSITHLREETLTPSSLSEVDAVVSMARRFSSLMMLEQCGKRVLNSPVGVRHALSRETTLDLLSEAGVPVPGYWAYDPEVDEMFVCESSLRSLLPGWVKGMHPKGVHAGDVRYVTDPLETDSRVISLLSEGYTDIVVTEHLPGFVLKAYCVAGELIHWMLPQQSGYSKFGDEIHNDPPVASWVDVARLHDVARRIGDAMQLQYYGFDAIVSGPQQLCVIDVNDAPSFSCCREEAADKIIALL